MPPRSSKSSPISRRTRSRTLGDLAIQPPELRSLRSRRLSAPRTVSIPSHSQRATACSTASQTVLPTSGGLSRPAAEEAPPRSLPSPLPRFLNYPQPLVELSSTELSLSGPPEAQNYCFDFGSGPELHRSLQSPLLPDQQPESFNLSLLEESDLGLDQQPELQDMSIVDIMMPSQYGSYDAYGAPLDPSGYAINQQTTTQQQSLAAPSGPSPAYAPSFQTTPPILGSNAGFDEQRTAGQGTSAQPYHQSPQPLQASPYQTSTSSFRASSAPMSYGAGLGISSPSSHSPSYPPLLPTVPSQPHGTAAYGQGYAGSSTQYEAGGYQLGYGAVPAASQLYPQTSGAGYAQHHIPSNIAEASATAASPLDRNVRVINARPKPQCWEHGCNGRQFSTFSNLLRHQREKSGTAAKSYCSRCGAEFTRTTARNGHMAHEKCKPRRTSEAE